MSKTIAELQTKIFETAKKSGWWEKYEGGASVALFQEVIASKLMLVTTELAEALEELRDGNDPKQVYYNCVLKTQGATVTETSDVRTDKYNKPEGFGVELADAVIRIMDLAEWCGIDLGKLIEEKMAYNESRPYKHGNKLL